MSNVIKNMRRGPVNSFYSVDHQVFLSEYFGLYNCEICSEQAELAYKLNIIKSDIYHYMNYGYRCVGCLVKEEEKFIQGIDPLKLPLFVNHVWVTPQGEEYYRERLSEGVPV